MEKSEKLFAAMVDCSRNGVLSLDGVKRFAKTIAAFGYNALMLYTEDTIEVEGEPFFGYQRGRYTKVEIQELDRYCQSLGVELIPCLETLAHLNQIFRYAPYQECHDIDDVLLVDEPKTYTLLDHLIHSCSEMFSSRHIHLGMDEARHLGRGVYLDQHGYENPTEIMLKHIAKVKEIAHKYGYEQPMFWGDMFYAWANHGQYYGKNIHFPEEVKAAYPKDLRLTYWDYYHAHKDIYRQMIRSGKELDPNLAFAGGAWAWVGFAPMNHYTLKTMKPAMEVCREEGVNDIIIAIWGDNGRECSPFAVLPSLYAIRQFYLGNENTASFPTEFEKITGESYADFMSLDDLNRAPKVTYNQVTDTCKWAFYNDPLMRLCDAHVHEGGAKYYRSLANSYARKAKKSKNYAYLFNSAAKLAKFMSYKYDLGVRTKKAYDDRDSEEITVLLATYKKAIRALTDFEHAFRTAWLMDEKPFGLEVHDQRMGGLKARLEVAMERLTDFRDGKIDCIPELDAKAMDYHGKSTETADGSLCINNWVNTVSSSVM